MMVTMMIVMITMTMMKMMMVMMLVVNKDTGEWIMVMKVVTEKGGDQFRHLPDSCPITNHTSHSGKGNSNM